MVILYFVLALRLLGEKTLHLEFRLSTVTNFDSCLRHRQHLPLPKIQSLDPYSADRSFRGLISYSSQDDVGIFTFLPTE
jgi:hypothetical protein